MACLIFQAVPWDLMSKRYQPAQNKHHGDILPIYDIGIVPNILQND